MLSQAPVQEHPSDTPCPVLPAHPRGSGSRDAARGALAEAVRWRQGILPEKTNKLTKHLDAEIQGGVTRGEMHPESSQQDRTG